jgi:hypothetical protein
VADRPIDAVIDHAAILQRQVDELSREVLLIAFAVLCLSVGMMFLSWRLWHAG